MPKSRKQKEDAKAKLVDAFKKAKSVVFADYQGLKVAQADKLRKAARESNVDYLVAKKTLFTLAAKEAGYDLDARKFPGMMGGAFGLEDEVAPAKVLGDMTKETSIKLVGGLFEGQMVDADKVIALSKLPSRQQLLGQVVGTIYAPVSAFVRVLNAIRESMDGGSKALEAPAAPVAEPKVEEKPVESAPEAPVAPAAEAPAAA
ncbi:50S ribosomal protein L10 [Candidatus Uhrbacteria bacterium]|nr:50S ribosomal protein L10 [Candidatus Uhrbacteria bacterium]